MADSIFRKKVLKKRIMKRALALFMAGAVIVSSPLGERSKEAVKAATTEYVKDVVLSYGKTEEDAEKWLKDNGYKVVKGDLHKGTDASQKTVNVVLMGYKTTTNPSEAITDISAMPMNGGFKITDMETILKNQSKEIDESVDEMILIAKEYKDNYKKSVKARAKGKIDCLEAIKVHDILNKFVDDDTNKGMGDIFLKDFSNESNRDILRNIYIQANPRYMSAMLNILTMASGDMDKTWVDRMVEINKNNSFFNRMKVQYKTKIRAKDAIEENYGEKLDFMVSDWNNLQDKIYESEEITAKIAEKYGDKDITEEEFNEFFGTDGEIEEIDEDMSEEEAEEAVENNVELQKNTMSFNSYTETLSVVAFLSSKEMNGETLYDFVMKERDFSKGTDRYEICALLEFLSDAQLEAFGKAVDTFTLIKYAFSGDNDTWEEVDNKNLKTMDSLIDDCDKTSIYTGVNREVFKGEVAVTSVADTRDINCTYGTSALAVTLASLGSLVGLCGTVIGMSFVIVAMKSLIVGKVFVYNGNIVNKMVIEIGKVLASKIYGKDLLTMVKSPSNMGVDRVGYSTYRSIGVGVNAAVAFLGVVIAAAAIVLSFISIKRIIDESKESKKGDYSVAIPQFMVDIYSDEDGDEDMVYYEAVRCNRNDPNMTGVKESDEGLEDYGDLNGDSGKCWVVPYTTKDPLAGDPILADTFEVKYGDAAFNDDVKSLHTFNEKNTGFNITSMVYNYNDKKDGTYLSYKTDKNAFNSGNTSKDSATILNLNNKKSVTTLITGFGAGLIFAGCIALASRKKKEDE
ncbi:MAG: hypothetical protein K6D02_10090 [Lachnospiraceae bacterium]|nr:hypothetical protein [Lachnospiraceae bacterium]